MKRYQDSFTKETNTFQPSKKKNTYLIVNMESRCVLEMYDDNQHPSFLL